MGRATKSLYLSLLTVAICVVLMVIGWPTFSCWAAICIRDICRFFSWVGEWVMSWLPIVSGLIWIFLLIPLGFAAHSIYQYLNGEK